MAKGLSRRSRAGLQDDVEEYSTGCSSFGVKPDAGVAACIKLRLTELSPHRRIGAEDMLALAEVLPNLTQLKSIDLSYCRIGVAGAQLLVDTLPSLSELTSINLQGCYLGPKGVAPLLEYLKSDKCTLEVVILRNNKMGSTHPHDLLDIVRREGSSLRQFDVSSNGLGESSVRELEQALSDNDGSEMLLDTEGNFFLAELLNSITHGIGFLLALQGTYLLVERGLLFSPRHAFAVGVYGISLCMMYLSSTLYHCLFKFRLAKSFFKYLDHSSIFSLIAGSYTPIMMISLHSRPYISYGLLSVVWVMCFVGMYISVAYRGNKSFDTAVIVLYLCMGWCCVIPGHAIVTSNLIPTPALLLIFMGGLFYSLGVIFVAAGRPFHHVIWHFFVLFASAFHFLAIFWYILPPAPFAPVNEQVVLADASITG